MSDPENGGRSPGGGKVKRSDSRRSPTTGHRRRTRDPKRSQSVEVRNAAEKLTSSEEELVGKCLEIVEQAKKVQAVRRRKHQTERTDDQTDATSESKEPAAPPALPWWKRIFAKKEKTEDDPKPEVKPEKKEVAKPVPKIPREPLDFGEFVRNLRLDYRKFKIQYANEVLRIKKLRNRCMAELLAVFIICGCGAFVFKTTEGTFELFYKCGVKRVKRDFVEELWRGSHFMKEEEWKSKARRKLMEFENQLQDAFEAGMNTYSGQRNWSFINAVVYCLTVITTIGPQTTHLYLHWTKSHLG